MSSKVKRNFLIAAKGNADWYNAVPETALAKMKGAGEALHVESALKDAFLLTAYDKYALLSDAAQRSAGVRSELVTAVAAEILKDLPRLETMITERDASELEFRSTHLTLDAWDDLYNKHSETEAEALTEDLKYLRSLPLEAFSHSHHVAAEAATSAVLVEVLALAKKSGTTADIETALKKMEGSALVDLAFSTGFDFGDRRSDWDDFSRGQDNPTLRFDVAKVVMAHWDEVGLTDKGRSYDAFAAGEGHARRVFIKRDFIQKKINPAN